MTTFKKLTIFLFLSICLSSSWGTSASTHDDFLECLSHQTMNSNSTSQVIHTPKNSSYSIILNSFSTNLRITSNFKPSIIFTPMDESQIQAAIHCSKKHGLQIKIRSGGHDYEGLSYISETPYAVIDLRNLRSISIDTINKTAWIQSGAILEEVYYRIADKSKKLAIVGGICPTVGVGGLFSGGGYSMMSRKFGLAAANIIDAKLIDANGQIQDRESMGEDLFWAIRGGGGHSFGLIISWKVKLVDIPEKVTVFNLTRTLEQNATQLLYKWQHIVNKLDDNLILRLMLTSSESPFRRGQRTVHVSFIAMFVGGIDELLHKMQKSFRELGLVKEDCIEMSWIESILFFAGFPRGTSLDVLLNRRITDEEGYFKRKPDYVQHPISIDGRYVSKSPRAAYFNYRDLDLGMNNNKGNTSYAQARIWGERYFKNNFDRLVQVKTKFDPTNFFRNEQSIPPLSS